LRQFARVANGPSDWRVAGAGTHLSAVLLDAHASHLRHDYRNLSGLASRLVAALNQALGKSRGTVVSLSSMAQSLGVSPRHLRRLVRRLTGKSRQEWISAEKAHRAKTMLLAAHTPKETAPATGFSDTSHLRRVLGKCYGAGPRAFAPTSPVGPSRT
jgi:AraC-like DNA-binding protein